MDIIQIVAIGLIAAILSLTLKKFNPEISLVIALAAGVLLFMLVLPKIEAVFNTLKMLGEYINIEKEYIIIVLKLVGIAYIVEFGIQICKDAGEEAIASKIEFAGKAFMMVLAAPVIISVMETIITLI